MAPLAPMGTTNAQRWERVPDLMIPQDLQYRGPCSIPGLEDAHSPVATSVPQYPVPDTLRTRTNTGHLQPSQPTPCPAPGAVPCSSALALQLPRDFTQIRLDLEKGDSRMSCSQGLYK